MLKARRVLQEVFGFEHFRPGQEAAIAALLAGRHALTVMPTGSGKSLCFQIPAWSSSPPSPSAWGIDKADVRYVFHTDLPGSVEAYYQEIVPSRARRRARRCAHALRPRRHQNASPVHRGRGRGPPCASAGSTSGLDALLGYCKAPTCRRVALLDYFGERTGACGNCDCCLDPSERVDGTEDAQKILSAAQRSGQRFGTAHVIDILRGSETEKIVRFGHQVLYGQ